MLLAVHFSGWAVLGSLQWRYNERGGVPNHRRLDCFLNRLFRRRSKKISKHPVTVLCEGNSPVTGGFPSQRASNYAENVSIWWRHHVVDILLKVCSARQICINMIKKIIVGVYVLKYKTAVSPLLTPWKYCSLTLSHRYILKISPSPNQSLLTRWKITSPVRWVASGLSRSLVRCYIYS